MIDDTYVCGTVKDLTTLSKLDENILLQELKARYEKQLIYVSKFTLFLSYFIYWVKIFQIYAMLLNVK